jgi:polysaccharide export outer membrane protein
MARFRTCGRILALLASLWSAAPRAADTEGYIVRKGDILEVAVAGLPILNRRAMVDVNGDVSLPLVGAVHAEGLPLARIRETVREELARRPFRQFNAEGRDNLVMIDAQQVTLEVAEYRPVFIRGDVAKPGELPFRPGMSVRQGIALAGGYDVVRFRVENPFLEAADLRSKYNTLWTEFARAQAQTFVLQEELRGGDASQALAAIEAPIPKETLGQIVSLERSRMEEERNGYRQDRQHLEEEERLLQHQLADMLKASQGIQASTEAQQKDLGKLRGLIDRGLSPSNRLATEERSLMTSLDRVVVASSEVTSIQRNQEEVRRMISKVDSDRRQSLLKRLQEAEMKLATLRASLQAVGERLLYVGVLKSQLVRGTAGTPSLHIYRPQAAGTSEIEATEDTPLMSGDVLEVLLKSEKGEDLAWP